MKNILITSVMILVFAPALVLADNSVPMIPMFKSTTTSTQQTGRPTIFSKLPEPEAELYQKKDEELKAKYTALNIKLRNAKVEANKVLLADPFNKSEYLKKASELKKIEDEKTDARINAIADLASKYTVKERRVLLDALEENTGKKAHNPIRNRTPIKPVQ